MIFIISSYSQGDLPLTGGLSIAEVSVTSDGVPKNNLVTYMEDASIQIAAASTIQYRRLNHQDFASNIVVNNPEGATKKVIIRLFLSLKKSTEVDGASW